MSSLRGIAKAMLKRTPYRVVRDHGRNRFQAIDIALAGLQRRGFRPTLVIDGGAHLGEFSTVAAGLFPTAAFHLIEPQEACLPALRALAARRGWRLTEAAFGAGDQATVAFSQTSTPSTGAHVRETSVDGSVLVPTITLDALFDGGVVRTDRVLLKLDLQGYELEAFRGGENVLPLIEVILTEVSFYAQAYEPSILELMVTLDRLGFQLYDIASLSGRWRDNRAHQGDFVFVRRGSPLLADTKWG
jgi:FkbM family methyltransferase